MQGSVKDDLSSKGKALIFDCLPDPNQSCDRSSPNVVEIYMSMRVPNFIAIS